VCPQRQGELRKLGEDVPEMLEYVPASLVVIGHVRTKLSCTKRDCIVQAEAPSRPIERGLAGPGPLAHVLVSKYCDHLPLYGQSEMTDGKSLSANLPSSDRRGALGITLHEVTSPRLTKGQWGNRQLS
jgi:transposase